MKNELLPCPMCGHLPFIQYACGEYFIMSAVHPDGECFCGSFCEMHASEEREAECWNDAVRQYSKRILYKSPSESDEWCENCCYREGGGGYCLDCYNENKKKEEKRL